MLYRAAFEIAAATAASLFSLEAKLWGRADAKRFGLALFEAARGGGDWHERLTSAELRALPSEPSLGSLSASLCLGRLETEATSGPLLTVF